MESNIRKPAVAGQFYPADPKRLRKEIERYLSEAAPAEPRGKVKGLISPHAGYPYSGIVAAHGYKMIRSGNYSKVVVFAPIHHAVYINGVSVYEGAAYKTPLGTIPVDTDTVSLLRKKSPLFQYSYEAHANEHSLEVQLPFLQVALGDFKLIPVLLPHMEPENYREITNLISNTLKETGDNSTLVIGSSDLYHGYSYQDCNAMDEKLEKALSSFDEKELVNKMQRREIMACGIGAILSCMMLSKKLGAENVRVLKRTNSADVTGNKTGYVVGYLSAAFY